MPAKPRQQLRLLYRIVRGHGPLLQTFNNKVLSRNSHRQYAEFIKSQAFTLQDNLYPSVNNGQIQP